MAEKINLKGKTSARTGRGNQAVLGTGALEESRKKKRIASLKERKETKKKHNLALAYQQKSEKQDRSVGMGAREQEKDITRAKIRKKGSALDTLL